ncbi:MAG TPA: ATP-binding protein [Rectinemataceae bacterium]
MRLTFPIPAMDFLAAGKASSEVKRLLARLGLGQDFVKRVSIAMYEGEMNVAIHGGGGEAVLDLDSERVEIRLEDRGPGIADLELAMTEGWSTASAEVRSMGFGAGMGLPNMKRNSDFLEIDSEPGRGTKVKMRFSLPARA